MKDIRISIIMPAYNASKYIRVAIQSVLDQTYENWQLVIVDDGSKDDTLQIAQEYAGSDSKNRIMVVHQENSGTAAAARNTALEYVTGDYVQILDSDDYLSTDCLQKYVNIMQREGEAPTIILPVALSVRDDGQVLGEISHVSEYVGQVISGEKAFKLSLDWTIHGWMFVCKHLIGKIKFDPLLINGDEFTTRKLFANAQTVMFTDSVYYYRDNQESTTKSSHNKARMYECLITDGNIYRYSISKPLPIEIQKKCARKWCKSLIAHKAQLMRDAKDYEWTDYQYANRIIEDNLRELSNSDILYIGQSVWGKAVKWCKGQNNKLAVLARVYNIFWWGKQFVGYINRRRM